MTLNLPAPTPPKKKNLKKTWRKSPASNFWAAIFKNTGSYSKFFSVFIIHESTSTVSSLNTQRLKDGNAEFIKIDTRVNMYVRKLRLLLTLNLTN